MTEENAEPPSTTASPSVNGGDVSNRSLYTMQNRGSERGFFASIKRFFKTRSDSSLREAIEEYIEEDLEEETGYSVSVHERALISNVLDLRDMSALDVMIPRADIVGIASTASHNDLMTLLSERQYSRFPVYKDTLDNVIGSIHVKDILGALARGEKLHVKTLVRDVPIISPSMHVLDLLTQMRMTRKHMAMVVDEYGGIDGLITIGDLIEAIVGEIDDEHDNEEHPEIVEQKDGTILADARVDLDEFEDKVGTILSEEERYENDTLGGLVFSIAGRVPGRGEVLSHHTGMKFEILEADPRRVNRLCIRNIPSEEDVLHAE